MKEITIFIDGEKVNVKEGSTVLDAVKKINKYIPVICTQSNLPPFDSIVYGKKIYRGANVFENTSFEKASPCGLCIVEISNLGLKYACNTYVADGMRIITENDAILEKRKEGLSKLLANHPHACILCAEKEGCTTDTCSLNVPKEERCCFKFGNCELQKVAEYIGVKLETPKYKYRNLEIVKEEPLFEIDYNLCINCGRCVRVCNELGAGALSAINYNGNLLVGFKEKSRKDSNCRFCGCCVEVCPTGALKDKNLQMPKEKTLIPCKYNCPLNINVPLFVKHIANKEYAVAYSLIKEKVLFPQILGRICNRVCEKECRRKYLDDAIAICHLKRFIGDNFSYEEKNNILIKNKRVAVVGGGPAGLSVAYYLAKKGYKITIFEAEKKLGGLIYYGIPRYRLPADVIEKELKKIFLPNIEVKFGTKVGKEISFEYVKKNYDAIFIGLGAQKSKKIIVEGMPANNIYWGLEFLKMVNSDTTIHLRGETMVIGGGNVAIDSALTALRKGAEKVYVVCLEKEEEMPSFRWEIEQALEEGIKIYNSWGPKKIIKDCRNDITAVELQKCISVFDENGNFAPKFDSTVTRVLHPKNIIFAIGQEVDTEGMEFLSEIIKNVNGDTLETSLRGVFVGGDVLKIRSVVDAIADGKKAASSIDKLLGGNGVIEDTTEVDKKIGQEKVISPSLSHLLHLSPDDKFF